MLAPVFHMLSNMNRQGRMVLASPSHIFAYTVPWDSVLGYKISLWDKPLCLAVGVRHAFWDTKRRALVYIYIYIVDYIGEYYRGY